MSKADPSQVPVSQFPPEPGMLPVQLVYLTLRQTRKLSISIPEISLRIIPLRPPKDAQPENHNPTLTRQIQSIPNPEARTIERQKGPCANQSTDIAQRSIRHDSSHARRIGHHARRGLRAGYGTVGEDANNGEEASRVANIGLLGC